MNVTNLFNFGQTRLEESQINQYDMNAVVAQSLCRIIQNFFMEMTTSLMIVISTRRRRTFYFFLNVLEFIFDMIPDLNAQLVFVDHKNPQRIEGPRFYNLLLIDSYEAFL